MNDKNVLTRVRGLSVRRRKWRVHREDVVAPPRVWRACHDVNSSLMCVTVLLTAAPAVSAVLSLGTATVDLRSAAVKDVWVRWC